MVVMLVRSRVLLAALLFAGIALGGCGTGERLVVPTPERTSYETMHLSCLHAVSADEVFVGGWLDRSDGGIEGVVLRSRDGGATWRRVGSELGHFKDVLVQSLHFNDRLHGWFCGVWIEEDGTSAVVARTEDGGGHWFRAVVPEPRATFISHLEGLSFSSDRRGQVDVVYEDETTGQLSANTYGSRDGGRSWIVEDFRDTVGRAAVDVSLHAIGDGRGYRIDPPDDDGIQNLYYTVSDGRDWRLVARLSLARFEEFYGPTETSIDR